MRNTGHEEFRGLPGMKIFSLKEMALKAEGGEYVLGSHDTGSHACYMIYGRVMPDEKGRLIKPGAGHEEIVLAVKGDLEMTGHYSGTLKEGEAVHVEGDHECLLENRGLSEAVYVIAGGHAGSGHH